MSLPEVDPTGLAKVQAILDAMNSDHPPVDAALADDDRTWQPVDLTSVLDGTYQPPKPTVGERDDGVGMFYLGRLHTMASESEGGKTFLALAQIAVELKRGNGVLFLDFEDTEGGVVGRLLALGVDRELVRDHFAYLRPQDPIGGLGNAGDLEQALADLRPTLAILDGVTEAMGIHGLDPLSNKDAARFGRLVPRYIAERGPATVSLDHLTKSGEGRGRYALGAVHKLNAVTGAAYLLENRVPFGIGLTGRSTVNVAKDRPGQLRRHAVRSAGGLHWFGDFVLNSHDELWAEPALHPPVEHVDPFRPTVYMRRITDALAGVDRALSKQQVEDRVPGKATVIRLALALLVDEGYIAEEAGPRGARLHTLIKPYIEEE